MKERLLELIVCPQCRESLELQVQQREGPEICEGSLHCRPCGASYPVRRKVPRFVDMDRYVGSFSLEWNAFHDVQIDGVNKTGESEATFTAKTGFTRESAAGKLFLDAGVGAGRFADVVSRWGAEVVGFDLSFAVDGAQKNIGHRENVHLVQADIFHPPFPEGLFDNMYSIGVLHHTPDTHEAFRSLAPLVRRGGAFAVYLYYRGIYHRFSDLWRKGTTRLPLPVMYWLSALAIPLYYLYRVPLLGGGLQLLAPISMSKRWRERWLDTFDWYTPQYQWKHEYPEVYSWFVNGGFERVAIFDFPICMRGIRS